MEEYHRDSLREYRRMEREKPEKPLRKGSFFITLIIVVLFAAAGVFYLKTAQPALFEKYFCSLKSWKEQAISVFEPQENDVQQTVDSALAEQDEAG